MGDHYRRLEFRRLLLDQKVFSVNDSHTPRVLWVLKMESLTLSVHPL